MVDFYLSIFNERLLKKVHVQRYKNILAMNYYFFYKILCNFYLCSGETDFNECESSPCMHGDCLDLIGRYQCRCGGTGFEGINCKSFFSSFA